MSDFFDFSPSERRGFIVVSCLVMSLFITLIILKNITNKRYDRAFDIASLERLEASVSFRREKHDYKKKSYSKKHREPSYNDKKKIQHSYYSVSKEPVLINSADSTQFKTIKGIGSVYASRIIKYRNLLHGFHSLTQLNEVYGLQTFDFTNCKPKVIIDSINIRWLDVNTMDFKTLVRHPYINQKQASQTVNYREKVSRFKNKEHLLKIYSIDSVHYQKIEPYLKEIK